MKKLYYSAILGLLFLVTCPVTAATIHLDKDTSLVPQGWSAADDDLKFKKDTTAELNINSELVKGTLKSDSYLRPTGWKNIINDYYMTETNHLFFPRFFILYELIAILLYLPMVILDIRAIRLLHLTNKD